mmetsp:Transcript_46257/g.83341  ORF Transcript_46257/g.83341 Transcript_46257/m.83341 type:complete len:480 (+) Transcript_46257:103-1542(+)
MDSWRRHGSFRQRKKNAESTTKLLKAASKHKVAIRTHEAIRQFEENLKRVQDAQSGYDDIPFDDPTHRRYHHITHSKMHNADNASDSSSVQNRMVRTMSDTLAKGLHLDRHETLHAERPPSPLHMYDYGVISVRPRSHLHQRCEQSGEPARPKYRQEICGHYFPGPDLRQGPYGSSLLDPILLPPRHWEATKSPPHRWAGDPSELRPATADGWDRRERPRSVGSPIGLVSSPSGQAEVKVSRCEKYRARIHADALGKRRDEAFLENVRFEHGVYEGRWKDPLLDSMGLALAEPELPVEHKAWTAKLAEQSEDDDGDLASHILQGIEDAMRIHRGKIPHLFRFVNRGVIGVLQPEEFLEGLQRLEIVEPGRVNHQDIIDVMRKIDPDFDGRVNFPALTKAIAKSKSIRFEAAEKSQEEIDPEEDVESMAYGKHAPVASVSIRKVDSICNFENSFDKFQTQQRQLIALMEKQILEKQRSSK